MPIEFTPELMVVLSGAFLSALVVGAVGFGDALVAAAIWLHVLTPVETTPLIVSTGLVIHAVPLYMLRHSVRLQRFLPFLIGGLIGIPLGVLALTQVSAEPLRMTIGVLLIVYGVYGLFGPSPPHLAWGGRAADGTVGLAGGFLGGLSGLSGILPTIWSEFRGWTPAERRGVYQTFIFTMHAATLALLWFRGDIGAEIPGLFLWCLPAIALGTLAGVALFKRLDAARFRQGVLVLLLVSGAGLLL